MDPFDPHNFHPYMKEASIQQFSVQLAGTSQIFSIILSPGSVLLSNPLITLISKRLSFIQRSVCLKLSNTGPTFFKKSIRVKGKSHSKAY